MKPVQGLLAAAAWLLAATASGAEVEASAPAFQLPSRDGAMARLGDERGKVVYLDFWASWCQPCRQSFPWMSGLQERHRDQGLVVLAVNVDAQRKDAETFLARTPAGFRVAFDPAGAVAAQYRVKGMPASYLIDREGRVRAAHVGFREADRAQLEAEIAALLAEGKAP